MIQIISGVYGTKTGMKRASDGSFKLSAKEEARLVNRGVAKYVGAPTVEPPEDEDAPELPDGVTGIPEYSIETSAKELREIGKLCGLTFKVGMSKAEMVAALDKHIEEHTVEGVEVNEDGEISVADDDDAPNFDAADAVVE